jgi:hypothetical protein
LKIRAGMEALATFDLSEQFTALMIPKDAVVTAGNRSLVYPIKKPVTVTVGAILLMLFGTPGPVADSHPADAQCG